MSPRRRPIPCTYRGCQTRARYRLEPPNASRVDWFACEWHLDGMVKALGEGCASDLGATVTEIKGAA